MNEPSESAGRTPLELEPGAVSRGCSAWVTLSAAERALYRALADPDETIEPERWCLLEDDHPGPHHGDTPLGAGEGDPWWLRWSDDGAHRELVAIAYCTTPAPVPDLVTVCTHLAGHGGGHQWRHDPHGIY